LSRAHGWLVIIIIAEELDQEGHGDEHASHDDYSPAPDLSRFAPGEYRVVHGVEYRVVQYGLFVWCNTSKDDSQEYRVVQYQPRRHKAKTSSSRIARG
jgi:hypothetical protein